MPSSTAARVAWVASSTRSFFSFTSTSVAPPTRITATPPASFARRSCSFSRSETGIKGRAISVELSGEGLQPAPQGSVRPAVDPLLLLIGEGSDQEIATEPLRRTGAMQLPPGKSQFMRRPIHQFDDLAVHLSHVRTPPLVTPG